MNHALLNRKECEVFLSDAISDCRPEKECWFSIDEYQTRLANVRERMKACDLEGLLVFSPANTYYLTGHHSIDSWEFRAVVISHDKKPKVLLFHFERGRFLSSSWLDEARYYGPGADPVVALLSMIKESGLSSGRLGVEANVTFLGGELKKTLSEKLPAAELVDATRLVDEVRACKSEQELTAIERAALLTELGMQAAVNAARVNATDNQIAAEATQAMLMAGSHNLVMMPTVAVGSRSGLAHSEHNGRKIKDGDSVFLELSACWRHYSAPLMKTLRIGKPDAKWDGMLEVAYKTADAIVRTAKVGVPARDVAKAAHEAMASIENEVQYHYNFGYSIGISFPPHWLEESAFYLTETNPRLIQSGMVFHLPITFRVLGQCASGMSYTIAVTDSGACILTGERR
jgi:Xaa-Pro dipeptidase